MTAVRTAMDSRGIQSKRIGRIRPSLEEAPRVLAAPYPKMSDRQQLQLFQ